SGGNRTLTAGTVHVDGGLTGGSNALMITGGLDLGATAITGLTSLSVSGNTSLGAGVTTTGNQTYGDGDDTATLATNVTVNSGGTVIFDGDVDGLAGGQTLTVATGDLEFRGDVGVDTNNQLGAIDVTNGNLTVTAAGTIQGAGAITADSATISGAVGTATATANTVLSIAIDTTSTLGADVETTGGQTYTGLATLGGNVTLTTPGTVQFGAGVSATADSLTITTGNLDLDGAATGLTTLSVDGTSNLGGDVTSTGDQTYTGLVTLSGADRTLTAANVNLVGGVDGTMSFALDVTGNLDLDATATNLTTLTVSGTTDLGANVETTGTQTYTGAVIVDDGTGVTLTSTMTDLISFGSTVDDGGVAGTNSLTIAGNASFGGTVGTTALDSLSVSGTTVAGGNISTTGTQTYTGQVTLSGGDRTFAGSNVDFAGGVAGGANALTVTGNMDLGAAASNLTTLSVSGTSNIDANVTTSGTQSYTGAVTIDSNVTLDSTGGALVRFFNTLNSAVGETNSLTIDGAGQFDGVVGAIDALSSISVSGATALNNNITTTGGQTYTGLATLGGDVNLTTPGTVQFVAGVNGTADSLTITTGNLDLDGAATGLTTLSVAGTSNLGADVTSTGDQTYTGAVTLSGGNRTLTAGTVHVDGGLTGGSNALTITGGLDLGATAITGLASLSVSGTSTLASNVTTANAQTYSGATTLAGGGLITLTSTMSDLVTFGSTLDATGAGVESLSVSGNAQFDGAVGTTALASVLVSGTTALNNDITTTGNQTYTGVATLGGDINLTTNGGSTVQFGAGVSATADSLTITNGNLDLDADATGLTTLSVGGTSDLAGNVTTTGTQTYSDDVVVSGGDVTVDSTTDSQIQFGGDVNADGTPGDNLTVDADARFDGQIGNLSALGRLIITGSTRLNGDVTTTDSVTFGNNTATDTVTVASNVAINTGGNTASFAATVDSTMTTANTLTITGNAEFDGVVGGNFALGGVSVSGTTALNNAVTTTSNQTYTGVATLGGDITLTTNGGSTVQFGAGVSATADSLTITNGNLDLDAAASGLTTLSVGGSSNLDANVTTSGTQSYTGAVTIESDVTLDSTGGALILFSNTVDSTMTTANTLTLVGDAQFDGAVGGTNNLGSVSVSGATDLNNNVTTTGNQTYTGVATLGGAINLTTPGTVQFGSGITGGTNSLQITTGNLDLDGAAMGLTTLQVSGTSNLGADVTSTGDQTYTGAVTLSGGNRTLTAGTVHVDDGLTGGSNALTITGGLDLGATAMTGLTSLSVSGASTLASNVTTANAQTYGGATTLAGGGLITLTSTMSDLVTFGSTLDATGAAVESLSVSGNAQFDGAVGATALASVLVSGNTALNNNITTTGNQTYTGAATLGGNINLTTNGGSTVQFGAGVTGTTDSLTITNGNLDLDADASGLTTLTVGGTSNLGGDVTSTGDQTYNGLVTLSGADRTLTAANVNLIGGVDGATTFALDVVGNLDLDSTATNLTTLTVSGTADLGADVETTGTQTYTGAVLIDNGTGITLNSTSNTLITFGSTIEDDLAVATNTLSISGDASFGGSVGATRQLESVSVTGTTLAGGDISTTGTQTYSGQVTLSGGDRNFTGSTVTYTNGVAGGANGLTVTGNFVLDAAASNLTTINVTGNSDIGANVTTSGTQTYGDNALADTTAITANVTLDSTGGALVLFNGTVDSTGTNTLSVDGDAQFEGTVGGTDALGSVSVSGATALNSNVDTTGNQTYTGLATLGGDITLDVGGTVQFVSGVSGTADALAITTGNLDLDAAATGLTTLSVAGTSNLGADVTSTGDQTYTGAVTLSGADRTLTAGTVHVDGGLAGGTNALTITGGLDLGATAMTGLTTLSVSGSSTLGGDITTSGNQTFTGLATLGGDVILDVGGTAQFVAGISGTTDSLTINTGNLDLDAAAAGLSTLSVAGTSDLGGNVSSSGDQTYTGAVTLSGGDRTLIATASTVHVDGGLTGGSNGLTITGNLDLGTTAISGLTTFSVSGTSNLGANVTSTGTQTYSGTITLAQDVAITSTTGDLNLAAITGAQALTLDGSAGTVSLNGNVGSPAALTALTLDANILNLAGDITVDGEVDLDSGVGTISLNGASTITTTGAAAGAGDIILPTTAGANTLTLVAEAASDITIASADIGTLTLTSGDQFNLNGNLETDAALNFSNVGDIVLGADLSITADNGAAQNITFGATNRLLGAQDLTLNGATVILDQVGNGTTDLTQLTVNATALTVNDNITVDGAVDLDAGVTAITLGANSTIDTTGSVGGTGTVALADINGAFDLGITAESGSAITLDGADIATLTLTSGDTLTLNGTIETDAAQDYSNVGNIVLGSTLSLIANNGAAQNMTFGASNVITGTQALTLDGATVSLFQVGDGASDPTGLTITAATATNLNENITVDGAVDLSGATQVNLLDNLVIDNTGGTDDLISLANVTGDFDLDLVGDTSSTITLNVVDVNSLDVTGDLELFGNITVDDRLDLSTNVGAINLNAGVVIDIAAGGFNEDISLAPVTGDFNLTLTGDASSAFLLNGLDVDGLTLTSGGELTLNGNVITDTAQDYTNIGNIVLTNNVQLVADNGGAAQNITFDAANVITGVQTLTVDGDTVTLFQIGDGASDPTQLNVTADTNLVLNGNITVDGDIDVRTLVDDITLAADATIDASGGANSDIQVATTTGTSDLTLITGGTGTITVDALDLNNLSVTGALDVNGNITADESLDLDTGVTDITLLSASTISVAAGGVDQSITLADVNGDFALTVEGDANSVITLNQIDTDQLAVTGLLTLLNNIQVDNNLDLRTNVGAVTLGNNVTIDVATDGVDQNIALADVSGDFTLDLDGDTNDSDFTLGAIDVDTLQLLGDDLILNGDIETDTAQDYTNVDDIQLAADVELLAIDGTMSQNITFDATNTITGTQQLTLDGDVVTTYKIGNPNDPTQLDITAATSIFIEGTVDVSGAVNLTSPDTNINATINSASLNLFGQTTLSADIITTDDLVFADVIVDGANIRIDTSGGDGDITFGNIDSAAATNNSLTLDAGNGNITVNGAVGSTDQLLNLTIEDATSATFASTIQALGLVSLTADLVDIDGNITAGGSISLIGTNLEIAGGTTIDAQGGALDIDTGVTLVTLDGTGTVTLQTSTADGNAVALAAVTATGTNNDLTISSTEGVNIDGTINIGTEDLDIDFDTLGGGTDSVTFAADQTITAGVLSVTGAGGNDVIDVTTAINASGDVTLETASTIDLDVSVTSGGAVTISGTTVEIAGGTTIDAQGGNLDIDTGVTTINLDGTGLVTLQTTYVDGSSITLSAINGTGTNNDLTISSTEGLDIDGTINLGAEDLDITFDTLGGGTDTLTLDMDQSITAGDLEVSGTGNNDTINVTTAINASGLVSLDTASMLDIDANIDAGASATLSATNVEITAGTTIHAQNGNLDIDSGVTGITLDGTGTVTIDQDGEGATASLAAISDDGAGDGASLTISAEGGVSAGTIDLGGTLDGSLSITADEGTSGDAASLTVGTVTNATNVAITNNTGSVALPSITAGGTLDVVSTSTLSQGGGTSLTVTGVSTFDAGASNLVLTNTGNNFQDTVNVTAANNATIVDVDAIEIGTANIGSTLNVTSGAGITVSGSIVADDLVFDASAGAGDITDTTGDITVTGSSTFTVQATDSVLLDSATNDFGSVSIPDAQNVSLRDEDSIVLNASDIGGTLDVVAAGTITGSQIIEVAGLTTLDAGGTAVGTNNISLTNISNDFAQVDITNAGDVTLADTNAITLGGSNLPNGTIDVDAAAID
ncbi:MAG: hypothetical protein JJ957_19940, partial [Pseudomonadales bacterium]|nr:hypothetical protein [Pseudomonadales bacterium]